MEKANKPKKDSKKPKKSTKAEVIQRVTEVLELLAGGHTKTYIVRYSSDKWGIGSRQAEEYISLATKELMEENQASMEKVAAQIKKQLWLIVRTATKQSDKVAALKELARISGIGTLNVNVTVDDKRELAHLTDEELELFYGSSDE